MKRFRSTIEAILGAVWYICVVVVLPVLGLLALGLWHLWQQGTLLEVLLWWLLIVTCSYALAFGWRKLRQDRNSTAQAQSADGQADALPEQLSVRPGWSEQDIEVWHQVCQKIEAEIHDDLRWPQMQALALSTLAQTANAYHATKEDKTWRFSLPEALLVLEETSRRYRQLVDNYLPFAEKITVASLLSLYDKQDNIMRGFTWANRLRRTVRLLNPIGALLGEVRDLVTDRVFAQVSTNMQQSLQRLLLQEVAQVAIDLYSGKLKVGADEMSNFRSKANQKSQERQVVPAEPIRVLVFGQVSAGKSSLVNALQDQTVAEADVVPVTDRMTVHALELPDMFPIHLVDTPGYGAGEPTSPALLTTLLSADLWILVAQLNRPARQADTQLLRDLMTAIQAQPMRRIPPLMVVLSHANQVPTSQAAGERSIEQIKASTLTQLQLPPTTPTFACDLTRLTDQRGIRDLIATLQVLEPEAVQVQFNRRRLELGELKTGWRHRLAQAGRMGSAIGGRVRAKLGPTKKSEP